MSDRGVQPPDLVAIALDGAKGVGRTATADRRAGTVMRLDSPERRDVLAADATAVLRARGPVVVDEWQLVPEVWDVVRRQVDGESAMRLPDHVDEILRSGLPGVRDLAPRARRHGERPGRPPPRVAARVDGP